MNDILRNRIAAILIDGECQDLNNSLNRIEAVLADYELKKKETGIILFDEKNNYNLIMNFLIHCRLKNATENTIRQYKSSLFRWEKALQKNFTDINESDIRTHMAKLAIEKNLSTSYALSELRCLSTFFTWLMQEGVVISNPILKVEKPKPEKYKKYAFTSMEIEKMRQCLDSNMKRALFELLLSTGCRISEICKIKKDSIRDDKVVVLGKGNKERTVYINAKAKIAIDMYLSERIDDNPYLFPSSVSVTDKRFTKCKKDIKNWYKNPNAITSGHIDKSSAENIIRKLGEKAGVDKCHPHRFRRTFATSALEKGMPVVYVSKLLGHESLDTTQIYLDINEKDLENAHRKYI